MTPAQRQKRLDRAQLNILFNLPFFAPGVMQLPVVWDDSIPTACTDGKVIRWNGTWFDKLKQEEISTVLCHEVMHLLYGHLWRAPAGVDPEQWNIACDHAVNLQLDEFSALIKGKGLADPFPFPPGCCVKDPVFKGVAEEAIYSRIFRPKSPGGNQGKQPQGQQGQQGQKPGAGQKPGQGNQPGQGQAPGQPQPFGQFTVAKPDPAAKAAKDKWEGVLIQSATIAKSKGKLPGGMERLIKELIEPAVPWYVLLRQWLREQAADDWNWQKPNVYFDDSELILPILESERIGPVVFATDTSGSINQDALAHFQSEKQACLDDLAPRELVDIYCDAAIHKVATYRRGETISLDAPGGGGTDFRPVFEHCETLAEQPKCLVFLTDLCGTFPEKAPGFPVIWVVWEKCCEPPFGTVVNAGE